MHRLKRRSQHVATLAAGFLLSGCAAPLAQRDCAPAGTTHGAADCAAPITEVAIDASLIARERAARASLAGAPLTPAGERARPYTIGQGDVLSVVVWDHPELSNALGADEDTVLQGRTAGLSPQGFVVDDKGLLQFPYAGAVEVEGLTEAQAKARLVAALSRYIKSPVVTLRVQAYRSKRVYIDGQVRVPGPQPITDIPMSLVEAINRAGGVTAEGDRSRLKLIRRGATYDISLPALIERGINPADILLVHGDILKVVGREENKVFLTGEVVTPRALPMNDGRLTLNQALGEAGGINPLSGDASRIYVVRRDSQGKASVYRLDASDPHAMALAEGFQLDPRDVVVVSATRLANWNRTISQMLPSAMSSAVGAARP